MHKLWARLRKLKLSLFLFQVASLLTYLLWTLPGNLPTMLQMGMGKALFTLLPVFVSPVILTLAHQLSVDSVSDMVRRPRWFLLVHTLGCAAAQLAMWLAMIALGMAPPPTLASIPYMMLFMGTLHILLLGGTLSWLSFLYLKSREDQAHLFALQAKHRLLTHQVERAGLAAARARIDPHMVARVLRAVRARYETEPEDASALLHALVDYLRLAMQRGPAQPANELPRASLALQELEAQYGESIDVVHTVAA